MKKKIEFEFKNARNGNWSYNVYYGLDIVGAVFGDEIKTKVLLDEELPESDMNYLLNQVASDLKINVSEIEVL